MISKKAKYGLQALIYLAKNQNKGPILISDLAEVEEIPKKFLEFILLELKNHGFLASQRGKGGGYYLKMRSEKIIIGDIIRLFDGPLDIEEGDDESCCSPIGTVMMEVRDAMSKILDHTSLADAIAKVNTNNINYHI